MGRDDPLPLASKAAELLARAAQGARPDAELQAILKELEATLAFLQLDEPHYMGWSLDEATLHRAGAKVKRG